MGEGLFDPSNPLHVAVRMTEFGGALSQMQQMFSASQQTVGSAIQGLQVDIHRAVEKLSVMALLSEKQSHDTADIKRSWEAIENLRADNARSEKRMNVWAGIAIGISMMSATVVASVTWFGRQYISNADSAASLLRAETGAQAIKADERLDRIEIHLAGDPQRPFRR